MEGYQGEVHGERRIITPRPVGPGVVIYGWPMQVFYWAEG
jgi:hypothetical protein